MWGGELLGTATEFSEIFVRRPRIPYDSLATKTKTALTITTNSAQLSPHASMSLTIGLNILIIDITSDS